MVCFTLPMSKSDFQKPRAQLSASGPTQPSQTQDTKMLLGFVVLCGIHSHGREWSILPQSRWGRHSGPQKVLEAQVFVLSHLGLGDFPAAGMTTGV